MAKKSVEQELREEILSQLKQLKPKACPKVYETIQTKSGYASIESMIISMVIHDKITPSACIAQIESEL